MAEQKTKPSSVKLSANKTSVYSFSCPPTHDEIFVICLFVGCLTSQQHSSVSQGRIGSDNFTCCHTEKLHIKLSTSTQSRYTDTGPTSPSTDPITPGVWQGSHWTANFEVTGMTRPGKIPSPTGFEHGIFRSRGGRLNH